MRSQNEMKDYLDGMGVLGSVIFCRLRDILEKKSVHHSAPTEAEGVLQAIVAIWHFWLISPPNQNFYLNNGALLPMRLYRTMEFAT